MLNCILGRIFFKCLNDILVVKLLAIFNMIMNKILTVYILLKPLAVKDEFGGSPQTEWKLR